ncbi:MAG: hypothetical protein U9P12_07290 [Verrucomicrobiota bacterium]|nr:hypothetical protein [Verrucomicrobiota bacterium]
MKRILMMMGIALLTVSLTKASYVEMVNPWGNLSATATWDGGVLPSGTSTGRVDSAIGNVWSGNIWYSLAVRQEGGYVTAANRSGGVPGDGNLALRGGADGSGVATIYEIDDARTDYASYTNFYVSGTLTMWSQFHEPIEVSVLSGHMEVSNLGLVSKDDITINMGDGIFHAESMVNGQGSFNMLAGGTGDVTIDVLSTNINLLNGNLTLNFESGNAGSFTFGEKTGGLSADGIWQALVAAGQVSIDGVVEKNPGYYELSNNGLASTLSLSATPPTNYVAFRGQNDDVLAPIGGLVDDRNWVGGVMPAGSSTGLVYTTGGSVWTGIHTDLAVRQTGGYVVGGDGVMTMRGGSDGSGITTIYEIEDWRHDYASYTNLYLSNKLATWSQFGNPIEFSLLSGHVEMSALNLNAANGTISLRDGILHVGSMTSANGLVSMLAGGTGAMVIDSLDTGLGSFYLNFETGSEASLTFGSQYGTNSASSAMNWLVSAGHVSIDGVADTDSFSYSIVNDGLATTIALLGEQTPSESYATWAASYGLTDTNGTAAMTANPDGDWLDNLAEYGLGGNPTDSNDQGYAPSTGTVADGGTNWFEFVHVERSDAVERGLSYSNEAGTDLVFTNWTGNGIEFVASGVLNAQFNTVTNRVAADVEAKQFVRLPFPDSHRPTPGTRSGAGQTASLRHPPQRDWLPC